MLASRPVHLPSICCLQQGIDTLIYQILIFRTFATPPSPPYEAQHHLETLRCFGLLIIQPLGVARVVRSMILTPSGSILMLPTSFMIGFQSMPTSRAG